MDRAYILHSIHTNKEMFYVGLTRHVQQAYLFVPKSNLNCLSYLKAQAAGYQKGYGDYLALNDYFQNKGIQDYLDLLIEQASQSNPKLSTLDFVTKHQLNQQEKEQQILELKQSPTFLNRLKGYGLAIWDQASTKIESHWQQKNQRKKESEFFSPVIEKLSEKVRVQETLYEPSIQEYQTSFIKGIIQANSEVVPPLKIYS